MDELSRFDGRAGAAERHAVARIRALRPNRRKLTSSEWGKLCELCLFLARFEQWFRTGAMNFALYHWFIDPLMAWDGEDLDPLLQSTIPPAALVDLEQLGRAAVADQRALTRLRPLVLNPNFALSVELGGADADLIAGDTLVDWKSTSQRPVGREQLWQLLGYVLADAGDEYGIKRVAVGAVRWRRQISWSVDELCVGLGGDALPPLDALRGEFAILVREVHAEQVARRAAFLAERQGAQAKAS